MKRRLSHRLLITAISVCSAVAATAAFSATASADVVPTHQYALRCSSLDAWGNRIVAQPIQLGIQSSVGATFATRQQFVYYRLWAYSYKYGAWYHSSLKRALDGYPNNGVEEYNAAYGYWMSPSGGFDGADLAEGPDAETLMPNTGTGTWFVEVQTYWAPPFGNMTTSDLTNPNAAPGGLNIYDNTGFCTF
jgi:hypothetical protein